MVGKYVNLRDSYIVADRSADRTRASTRARASSIQLRRGDRDREARHGLLDGRGRDPGARRLRRARHRGQDHRRSQLRAREQRSRISASASACRSRSSSTRATSRARRARTATEFDRATPHPVIALITEWQDRDSGRSSGAARGSDLGGTMRLGAQEVSSRARLARAIRSTASERDHGAAPASLRVQQPLSADRLERAGMAFTGCSRRRPGRDDRAARPSVVSSRASSTRNSRSTPRDGHPLFSGLHQGGARAVAPSSCRVRCNRCCSEPRAAMH